MIFMFIKKNIKSQMSLNIAFTVLLTFSILSITISTMLFLGTTSVHQNTINEIGGYDGMIIYNPQMLSDDEIHHNLNSNTDVNSFEIVKSRAINTGAIKNIDDFSLEMMNYDTNVINYNIETSKHNLELDDNEIYVPFTLKGEFEENDKIIIEDNIELIIAGFFEDPYLGSKFQSSKVVLCNEETYNGFENSLETGLIYVELTSQADKDAFTTIERNFKNDAIYLVGKNDIFMYVSMLVPILFTTLLSIISICLLIIAILVLADMIKTFIYNNYKEYGIMMSLGFTKKELVLQTILKNIIISSIAVIIAILISYYVLPPIAGYIISTSGLLWTNYFDFKVILVIYLALISLVSFISYFYLRRINKISILRAITNRGPDFSFKNTINISILKLHILPINIAFSIKKLGINFRNYLSLLILTISLCAILFTTTALLFFFSNETFVSSTLGLPNSDIYLEPKTYEYNQAFEEINQVYKIEDIYTTRMISVSIDELSVAAIVQSNFDNFNLLEGRAPKNSNEIMLTPVSQSKFNLNVSDVIELTINNQVHDYIVVGITQSVVEAGLPVYILDDEKIPITDSSYNINITLRNQSEVANFKKFIETNYSDTFNILGISSFTVSGIENISTIFGMISLIAYIITIIFVGIISYFLIKSSIIKDRKDIGILKTIGFSNKEIRRQFTLRLLSLTVIGAVIGVVLGRGFGIDFLSSVFKSVGVSKVTGDFTWYMYAIPFITLVAINMLFTLIATKLVNKVEIKELITE